MGKQSRIFSWSIGSDVGATELKPNCHWPACFAPQYEKCTNYYVNCQLGKPLILIFCCGLANFTMTMRSTAPVTCWSFLAQRRKSKYPGYFFCHACDLLEDATISGNKHSNCRQKNKYQHLYRGPQRRFDESTNNCDTGVLSMNQVTSLR